MKVRNRMFIWNKVDTGGIEKYKEDNPAEYHRLEVQAIHEAVLRYVKEELRKNNVIVTLKDWYEGGKYVDDVEIRREK